LNLLFYVHYGWFINFNFDILKMFKNILGCYLGF
jgi:hypothetical protein